MIACDGIIDVMDIVSTKMTNNIATSTVSIDPDGKKVIYIYIYIYIYIIDCYILHTVLLVIILLLIITIICYYYAKHRSKQKGIDAVTI